MGSQLPLEGAQFSLHVYCSQTGGWTKTPLGTEVDVGPGYIVLDGSQLPAKGTQQPPLFSPCLLWPRSPISAAAELFTVMLLMGIRGCQTVSPSVYSPSLPIPVPSSLEVGP